MTTAPTDSQGAPFTLQHDGLVWSARELPLEYRVGRFEFGQRRLHVLALETPCLALPPQVSSSGWRFVPSQCRAVFCPALPVEGRMPMLSHAGAALRYVLKQEDRYFITLEGSYEAYLSKFSGKTRNTFRRHQKRYAEAAGGAIEHRSFATKEELDVFYPLALELSRQSHQHRIGFGLPETPGFVRSFAQARGYLLMHQGIPAAYAFCPIERDVITYAYLGYRPDLEDLSPGRILLLQILEQLFAEKPARVLDFGAQSFGYKAQFATGHFPTARLLFFRPGIGNIMTVLSHAAVRGIWHGLSNLRGVLRRPAS